MRRFFCFLMAMAVCLSLSATVMAAGVMTPSVPAKDAPTLVPGVDGDGYPVIGEIVDGSDNNLDFIVEECLVVTPVSEAGTSDKIPQASKETLLNVYKQLSDGTMKLPYGENVDPNKMVIRDLFDVSWICDEHKAMAEDEHKFVKLTFDTDIPADAKVTIMVYENGKWVPAKFVKNNGDGTITCILENVGVVAIAVPTSGSSQTGDETDLTLPAVLLAISAVALVALVVIRRRVNEA